MGLFFIDYTGVALKQPKPLIIFFLTELWERYGFYVIQSLLALYLSLDYGLSDAKTYALVGSFTALTYVSPIIGGMIADKLLGQKISILLGTVVLSISYSTLSMDHALTQLMFSLAGVSVGTGLLKPNISSLLGQLYDDKDPRRDSGFTLFYMGITIGIILGTVLPANIVHNYGWPAAFGSAALGALFAFLIFSVGIKFYRVSNYAKINRISATNAIKSVLYISGFWLIAFIVLQSYLAGLILFTAVALLAATYVILLARGSPPKQYGETMSILYLCIISTIFWAFYFQMFSSLTLFINRLVIPVIAGIKISAPYYVTVQSVGMILFGAIFVKVWRRYQVTHVAYTAAKKFLAAVICMLVAYGLITLSILTSAENALVLPVFIVCAYLSISLAELLLSPVGLSAITQLAQPNQVSTLMGVFFISLGLGGYLSGGLAQLTALNGKNYDLEVLKSLYLHGLAQVTLILMIGLVVTALLTCQIKKLSRLKNPV